jgi:ATP-dependent RNA helicase DeaD
MENLIFSDLLISSELKKAVKDMGFEEATQIQSMSIPEILKGNDIIGQAQTGTGKTCAFGIPVIEKVKQNLNTIQALVLCPTRELAIQSSVELQSLSKYKRNIRILPVYGGQPIDRQFRALRKKPQIIIGTPGRVIDHIKRRTLNLSQLRMLILDEADEMLNMGFREDIDQILSGVTSDRQTILFSATMPKEIMDITSKYQKNPINIKVLHKQVTVPNIEQFYLEVSDNSKLEVLSRIIDTKNVKLSLIFCNTKKKAEEVANNLQSRGYSADYIHGDIKQEQRDRVMKNFRNGNLEILTATDVAARGIDIDNIDAVFNFDIPNDEENYVHRVGRTGRAGKKGKAFNLVVGREIFRLRDIQKYTKSQIKKLRPPTLDDVEDIKINEVLENMEDYIEKNNLSKYINLIEKALEDINQRNDEDALISTTEAAAALLKLFTEKKVDNYESIAEDSSDYTENENEMIRLFVNVGRNFNIHPRNIVECITSTSNLPDRVVGSINIYDKYTFVEVPRKYSYEIVDSLKNYRIKGRRINIERAHRKNNKSTNFNKYRKVSRAKYNN